MAHRDVPVHRRGPDAADDAIDFHRPVHGADALQRGVARDAERVFNGSGIAGVLGILRADLDGVGAGIDNDPGVLQGTLATAALHGVDLDLVAVPGGDADGAVNVAHAEAAGSAAAAQNVR